MARRSPRQKQAAPGVASDPVGVALPLLKALLIVAAGWWVYLPALNGGWLWDDALGLSGNPLLHDPARLWKIWFVPGSLIEYYPLEQTVQWAQWNLWGGDTFGYHATNVALHLLGALLVWRLLAKFGLRLAWLGGLIFAVHPVQVESVAWIAEFKNTLSLPPFLLALCAWIDFEERRRRADYLRALGWFLVAMLCKISMILFPALVLLYAWWRRGRIGRDDLKSAAPLALVSLMLGWLNVACPGWFHQAHGQFQLVPVEGFLPRLALAGLSTAFGLWKCLWPAGLLPVYPKWPVDPPSPVQFLPWPAAICAGAWLWRERSGWGRHAILGLGFFLLLLAPCPGFLPAPNMDFTWVMDHFFYLPIIGLIGLAVAGLECLGARLSPVPQRALAVAAILPAGLLAGLSHDYAKVFADQETLWTYTLREEPGAWVARNNLGYVLLQRGRLAEALEQFEQALVLHADYPEAHNNRGLALQQLGRMDEAMEEFNQVLKICPDNADAHYNLGNVLAQAGRPDEAAAQYRRALGINPGLEPAHNNLGILLRRAGQIGEALEQYQAALRLDPDNARVHDNYGNALVEAGRAPEAMDQFETALRLDPDDRQARANLERLQSLPPAAPAGR